MAAFSHSDWKDRASRRVNGWNLAYVNDVSYLNMEYWMVVDRTRLAYRIPESGVE